MVRLELQLVLLLEAVAELGALRLVVIVSRLYD